jgi:ABC-type transport system substrate-binding protein
MKLGVLMLASATAVPAYAKESHMNPLRIALPDVELTIDPHAMEDAYSMLLVLQVHRGLFRYSPEGDVLPDLVESWEERDGGRRYLFRLRDATFSDGTKITSVHVVHSLARIFERGASIGADIEAIKGAKTFRSTKRLADLGVRAVSTRVVELELERPSSLILKQLAAADCAILRLDGDSPVEGTLPATAPGAGPYKVTTWGAAKIILEKWRPDHLDSEAPPAHIEVTVGGKSALEQALADTNDVLDWDVLDEKTTHSLKTKGWRAYVTDLTLERFVILNPARIPLEVRRYLFKKTDQQALAKAVGKSSVSPAYGVIPSGVPGALDAKDMEALKAAIPTSTPKGKVRLQHIVGTPGASFEFSAWLKAAWEAPGFEVELAPLDHNTLLTDMFKGTGEALIGGKGLDYFDGYSVLTYFRSSYDSNYFHVKSPAIDAELDAAATILDPALRHRRYRAIQHDILREYTVIPLVFGGYSAGLWSERVQHVPPHPGGLHTLPLETVKMR